MEKYFFIVSSTDIFSVFDVCFLEVELLFKSCILKRGANLQKKMKKNGVWEILTQFFFVL